ncbi:MAG: hypothetical protein HY589_05740 [Candidatus Omnitrophica bacterium]|nr:hypothetical protein [Candidatus Omnitrophota bacterium]
MAGNKKIIAIGLIAVFTASQLGAVSQPEIKAPASALRQAAFAERRGPLESLLGPSSRPPETLEEARQALVRITDWFIAQDCPGKWHLPYYRAAAENADLVDDSGVNLEKGLDISPFTGVVSKRRVIIGRKALSYLKIPDGAPPGYFIRATVAGGESIGFMVQSITQRDARGIYDRVHRCVTDDQTRYFRLLLNKFQGGYVTPSKFRDFREFPQFDELSKFLQPKKDELLDRVAEFAAGEYIEIRERSRMVRWLRDKKLFDVSALPFLDGHDRWLCERGDDRLDLLALVAAYLFGNGYADFISNKMDDIIGQLHVRVYGFFMLGQVIA